MRRLPLLLLLTGMATTRLLAADVVIDYARLTPSLKLLTDEDRSRVGKAVDLIKSGNDGQALAVLSSLASGNPENSSLRILSAYAMLRLGNLVGALDQARKAEKAPGGDAYKCVFLSEVALAAGDRRTCSRELGHARNAGERGPEIADLESRLNSRNKKKLEGSEP